MTPENMLKLKPKHKSPDECLLVVKYFIKKGMQFISTLNYNHAVCLFNVAHDYMSEVDETSQFADLSDRVEVLKMVYWRSVCYLNIALPSYDTYHIECAIRDCEVVVTGAHSYLDKNNLSTEENVLLTKIYALVTLLEGLLVVWKAEGTATKSPFVPVAALCENPAVLLALQAIVTLSVSADFETVLNTHNDEHLTQLKDLVRQSGVTATTTTPRKFVFK
jgi:hypothetical protein